MKAFHLDCKNLRFQGYLVDLLTPWLDLPDDEQLRISEYLANDVLLGFINVLDDFTCNFQEIVSRFRFAEIFVTRQDIVKADLAEESLCELAELGTFVPYQLLA